MRSEASRRGRASLRQFKPLIEMTAIKTPEAPARTATETAPVSDDLGGLRSRSAIGTWSGGRFMKFGKSLGDEGLYNLLRAAPAYGVNTFVTSDVYAKGGADSLLGEAIESMPRNEISVVSMIGHDFYTGNRHGMGGYQRFTDPDLRGEAEYGDYLVRATERSLERCKLSRFDLLLLHNPDSIGYSSPVVWKAMARLKDEGLHRYARHRARARERFRLGSDLLFREVRGDDRLGDGHPKPPRAVAEPLDVAGS